MGGAGGGCLQHEGNGWLPCTTTERVGSDSDIDGSESGEDSDRNDADSGSGDSDGNDNEDLSPKVVVITSNHSDIAPQFAEWERHTKVLTHVSGWMVKLVIPHCSDPLRA